MLSLPLGSKITFCYLCKTGNTRKYTGRLIEQGLTKQKSTRTGEKGAGFIDIETKWSAQVCSACKAPSIKRKDKDRYCPNGCKAGSFEKGTIWVARTFNASLMSNLKVIR